MQPSSSSQPPDHPGSKSPPPPAAPAMGYLANHTPSPNGGAAEAPPPATGNGAASAAAFGVAYPYPAPPPHHPLQRYGIPYPAPRHLYFPEPTPPTCLRRLLKLVGGGFLLAAITTLIVWVLLPPDTPAFSLTSLNLSRVAYTPAKSALSASFDTALLVSNPNVELTVTYNNPLVSVAFTPFNPRAAASLPSFSQRPGNTTMLAFSGAVENVDVGSDYAASLKSSGRTEVEVGFAAIADFHRGGLYMFPRVIRVLCDRVPVVFRGKNSTEASFNGPARRCHVWL